MKNKIDKVLSIIDNYNANSSNTLDLLVGDNEYSILLNNISLGTYTNINALLNRLEGI